MDLASRARIAKALQNGRLMDWQKRAHEAKERGLGDLFASEDRLPPLELEEAEAWTEMQALEEERKAIGFYLSGHPLDKFFALLDYANEINETKRQNDLKYGGHLLNRPKEMRGAKRNGCKYR